MLFVGHLASIPLALVDAGADEVRRVAVDERARPETLFGKPLDCVGGEYFDVAVAVLSDPGRTVRVFVDEYVVERWPFRAEHRRVAGERFDVRVMGWLLVDDGLGRALGSFPACVAHACFSPVAHGSRYQRFWRCALVEFHMV